MVKNKIRAITLLILALAAYFLILLSSHYVFCRDTVISTTNEEALLLLKSFTGKTLRDIDPSPLGGSDKGLLKSMPAVMASKKEGNELVSSDTPSNVMMAPKENTYTGIERIMVGGKEEALKISPHIQAGEGSSVQVDDELLIHIGGYTKNYNNVTRSIQFFNITSQTWISERMLELPPEVAETHQGVAFEASSRMLYVISGQKGPGCSPATSLSVRIDIDTGRHEWLPDLPQPRFSPGVEILTDPRVVTRKYLHVFGGAGERRDLIATNHWRLTIDSDDITDLRKLTWEELESVPDAGTHGRSFQYDGYIYSTAFCSMDQAVLKSKPMAACQRYAVQKMHQVLHHFTDAGHTFRYPVHQVDAHWERLTDMPFAMCHTGGVFALGKLFLLGGGTSTKQVWGGSYPSMEYIVQIYDPATDAWDVRPYSNKKGFLVHTKANWYDARRNQISGLRPAESFITLQLSSDTNVSLTTEQEFRSLRRSFLRRTRGESIRAAASCIQSEGRNEIEFFTVFDKEYDNVRGTWNKRVYDRQFPDFVTFPNNTAHISGIVKCAKRSGYRVCGRNGNHSFEGDTCTYGIVVDVRRLTTLEVLNREKGVIRSGSGMFLGRLAVELAPYKLTLPMGHCASVGLTGLVLVGGQGLLSRHYGMTSDFVESIELVDHNGKIINATRSNEYSDYLWLARGGGSAVEHFPGIITAIQFVNIPNVVTDKPVWTKFQFDYNATVDNAEKLLLAWQEFYLSKTNKADPLFSRLTAEPWLWLNRFYSKGYKPSLFLVGYFYGNDQEHKEFMDRIMPKLESWFEPTTKSPAERYDDMTFHRMLGGVANNRNLASGVHGWDLKETRNGMFTNHWKGYSAVASDRVTGKAFRTLAESIFSAKPYSRRYVEFKPLGGAIGNLGQNATAFWHRNALWWSLSSHSYMSKDKSDHVRDLLHSSRHGHDRFIAEMGAAYQGGYAGYIDRSNSSARDLERYYGKNGARISQIKHFRDPHNLFRNYLPTESMANAPFDLREPY